MGRKYILLESAYLRLFFSNVITTLIGTRVVRMSIVANMKKSVHECMPKREATLEGVRSLLSYLNQIQAYRRPGVTVGDFICHGAGSEGIFLSYNKTTKDVSSVALLSAPAMDKDTFMFSSVLSALVSFQKRVQDFYVRDAAGILVLLRLLCNIEVLVQVLLGDDLLASWQGRWDLPGGLPSLIIRLIRERTGGLNITSGNVRRHQPFLCHPHDGIPARYLTELVDTIVDMSIKSRSKDWSNANESLLASEFDNSCIRLGSVTMNGRPPKTLKDTAFGLANQVCVKALYMAGVFLPIPCFQQARMPSTSTTRVKRKNKPLNQYVLSSSSNTFEASKKFQDCVGSYLDLIYSSSGRLHCMNASIMENTTCECYRSDRFGARDLVFVGQLFFIYDPQRRCLQVFQGSYEPLSRRFSATRKSDFHGLAFSDNRGDLAPPAAHNTESFIPTKLRCEITGEEGAALGREDQIVLTEETVGLDTLHHIKVLCMETSVSTGRVLQRIAAIPQVRTVLRGARASCRSPSAPLQRSVTASREWNLIPDVSVLQALQTLPPQVDLTSADARVPTRPRKPPKRTNPRATRWDTPSKKQRRKDNTGLDWGQLDDETFLGFDFDLPFQQLNEVFNVETSHTEKEPPKLPITVFDVDSDKVSVEHVPLPAQDALTKPKPKRLTVAQRKRAVQERLTLGKQCVLDAPRIHNVDTGSEEVADAPLALAQNQSRARPKAELPSVLVDGIRREIDWSASNLDRLANPVRCGNVLRRCYKSLLQKFHISGREFRNFKGTRDLQQAAYGVVCAGTLFDVARNAINSVPPLWEPMQSSASTLPDQWNLTDFSYAKFPSKEGKSLFVCRSVKTPDLVFNREGVCSLCDDIAHLYGATKFHDQLAFWWGFDSEERSRSFYLVCAAVTCGSSRHYELWNNRARRKFRGFMKQKLSLESSRKPVAARITSSKEDERGQFVVAYTPHQEDACPYFFVIGTLDKDNLKPSSPLLANDFCIAIVSPKHWEENRENRLAGKKGGRKDPGPAIFIRPLLSDRCLHLEAKEGLKKRAPQHWGIKPEAAATSSSQL